MKTYFASLNILSPQELDRLDQYLIRKTFIKGQVILEYNMVCSDLYFVKTGALRSYYLGTDYSDITCCMAFKDEFMTAYTSFLQQVKSKKAIHVLLDTEADVISYDHLEKLYDSSINWQKAGRKLIEHFYSLIEEDFREFQYQNGSSRYEYLLKNHAPQISQIPQHYVATYLGMSARQLSRIRKSLL